MSLMLKQKHLKEDSTTYLLHSLTLTPITYKIKIIDKDHLAIKF
jgi:hypothetical protein